MFSLSRCAAVMLVFAPGVLALDAKPLSIYTTLFEKIRSVRPAMIGRADYTLDDLARILILPKPYTSMKSSGEIKVAGRSFRYELLEFAAAHFGNMEVGEIQVAIKHGQIRIAQRVSFTFVHPECIDSAPIISRLLLNREVVPDSGPGAEELLYGKQVGSGKIWLTTKAKMNYSGQSCASRMGLIFSANNDEWRYSREGDGGNEFGLIPSDPLRSRPFKPRRAEDW